jgi:hypothetical protein
MSTKTKTPEHDVKAELETIERLQQQAREIAAQLKVAEAALSPLDKVIARQATSPANIIILQRVRARIGAGQDKDSAIAEVVQATTDWLERELDKAAE